MDSKDIKYYLGWRYKNTILLLISLVLLYLFADRPEVISFIELIGGFGYFGAFLVGMMFVSTFTVAPSLIILYRLAETLDPFSVAILAGSGAVIGDYIIFRFYKDRVFSELRVIFRKLKGPYIFKIFTTPYFAWFTPLLGATIIASPFPDEVGVGILGISKIQTWKFILVSFLLNATGIFIVVTIARSY